jgi:HEAT repeat protein
MIFAGLLVAAACAASDAPPDARRLANLDHALRFGGWNERVHATEELGELGAAGLPGLRVAAEDADWQVRLTAVHLMGLVGAPAATDLARVLSREPCRNVRLTALHWLGALGPAASVELRESLQDESGMIRLMGRYWLKKEGNAAPGEDEPGLAQAAAREDLLVCAASAEPARAPWARESAPAPKDQVPPREAPPLVEELHTPEPFARRAAVGAAAAASPFPRERIRELDALLSDRPARAPESFPPGAPGAVDRSHSRAPQPAWPIAPAAPPSVASAPPPARGTPETLPGSGLAFGARLQTRAPEPVIASNAPDARPQTDPAPSLLVLLKSEDPRSRALAADELGRLGESSARAVPALTKALQDGDRRVRASAALALGNIGPSSDASVPALLAALKRGPEEVSWSAALALGRIGTPRARKAFARYARQTAGELVR